MLKRYLDFEAKYIKNSLYGTASITVYDPKVGKFINTKLLEIVKGRAYALDSDGKRSLIKSGYYPIYDESVNLTF